MTAPATAGVSLEGRSVLVTGGGRGVGRGICLACAGAGASVAVLGPADNCADTVEEIARRGGEATWFRADVGVAAEVDKAVTGAATRYGGLDAIVHNATSRRSSLVGATEDLTDDQWADHASVSLRGAYLCAAYGLPYLQRSGGRLLVMASPAGMEGSETLPAYAAVKGGLRGFVKSLAIEWGPLGVTVACVSPLAQTPALDQAYRQNPGLQARLRALVPLGRIGDPETDIAPAVAFLVSDAARYITGQTIVVDGGRFTTL